MEQMVGRANQIRLFFMAIAKKSLFSNCSGTRHSQLAIVNTLDTLNTPSTDPILVNLEGLSRSGCRHLHSPFAHRIPNFQSFQSFGHLFSDKPNIYSPVENVQKCHSGAGMSSWQSPFPLTIVDGGFVVAGITKEDLR
jgi:hypothetical protein